MNKKQKLRGFTLIELLVVISIILIASSIIFIGGSGGDGAALSSSQRIVAGVAQGARGQAILKNARTRLIIYADTGASRDDEKYMRYFGIVYEDNDNPGQWIAATQGTYLPEGIYFEPNVRSGEQSGFNIEYPVAVSRAPGGGESYDYYEFNSNGTMATTPNDFTNSWLVIRAKTLKPDSVGNLNLVIDDGQASLIAGLIFRRTGTTTLVSDPSEIDSSL